MTTRWLEALRGLALPRLVSFGLVGISGIGVNSGLLWLLVSIAGLPLVAASALAIESAIWNNFLLNDVWTFHGAGHRRPWWMRALAFHATAVSAGVVNLTVLIGLVQLAGLHYLLANLLAIGVAAAVNYSGNALWTWRPAAPLPRGTADRRPASGKNIVVVPTYNESENVDLLIRAVLAQGPDYEVLVVDDASPDGTGRLVAERMASEPRIHLLRRHGKLGLGTAYVDGFLEALRLGAGLVLQMDCDLSHDPDDLPRLVAAAESADVVIGSRYVPGGRTVGWPWYRKHPSEAVSLAARCLLGIPFRDVTGGFKCWRKEVLEELPLRDLRSRGFAFQIETNYLSWQAGYRIKETPITFVNRRRGRSKLSLAVTLETAALLWRLSLGTPSLRRLAKPQLLTDKK